MFKKSSFNDLKMILKVLCLVLLLIKHHYGLLLDHATNYESNENHVQNRSFGFLDHWSTNDCPQCGINNVLNNTNFTSSGQTQFGEIPWMLVVFKNKSFTFAASLIHPKMAMTAAHYVSINATYKVRAGEWNWNNNDTIAHQHRFTEKVIIHPKYTLSLLRNDIALLLLETPFTILPHVSPICLPNPSIAYNPTDCIATGWGQGFQGIFQNVLRKVKLSVIPNKFCAFKLRESKGPHFPVHGSYICVSGYNSERTAIGDGGGPLVCSTVQNKNTYQQVGIISWQLPKPRRHDPEVCSNVTLFRDWILDVMDNNGLKTCI